MNPIEKAIEESTTRLEELLIKTRREQLRRFDPFPLIADDPRYRPDIA